MMRSTKALPLVALLFAGTSGAQFCPGVTPWTFNDVPASDPFCSSITWLAQKGVTLGCQAIDANNRLFCPADGVRRDQMAAFMSRLSDGLFPATCLAGQVMKWNGLAWACSDDNIGGGGGGGTVTSVAASTGLTATPNPITGAGTISADTTYLQRRVSTACNVGSSIRAIAADGSVTCETDDAGPANAFVQGGNFFGLTAVIGTNDGHAVEIRADGVRVMRFHPNAISPNILGGSPANSMTAGVRGATIAGGGSDVDMDPDFGGRPNQVTDAYGTVTGGSENVAGDGAGTAIDRPFATVGGGESNRASGTHSTVAGGGGNSATAARSVVCGGSGNVASGAESTIGGGEGSTASGRRSSVVGGADNEASGEYGAIGGGVDNIASGRFSAIGGGSDNVASGDYSVAMGRRAKAVGNGSFSFADSNNFDFSSNTPNAFRVRATGGVRFVTDIDGTGAATWSCLAVAGAGWACASDRNLKHSLVALDSRAVLDKVAAMPIYQWQPKGQNAHVMHYGPMAQDFRAAFGLGDDDTMIGMQDADGVALAAIKGLNDRLEEQIAAQAQELARVKSELAALRDLLRGVIAPR